MCCAQLVRSTELGHGREVARQTVFECFRTREAFFPNSAVGFSTSQHFQTKFVQTSPAGCLISKAASNMSEKSCLLLLDFVEHCWFTLRGQHYSIIYCALLTCKDSLLTHTAAC